MADATLALTLLATNYRGGEDGIVRQINRQTTGIKLLKWERGSGPNCAFGVEADGAYGEDYSDGADASTFGSDAQAAAVLGWGLKRANFRVTGLAEAAAASADTPVGNKALWTRQIRNASAKLASLVNVDLYTGAGTTGVIAGLDVAIGDTANTYAGINRATPGNEYWQPTVVDPGAHDVTLDLIRSDTSTIYTKCGEKPDIGLCSPDVHNRLASLFDDNRRFSDTIRSARGEIKLDAGFDVVSIGGCQFVEDKDAPVNTVYYINSQYAYFKYLESATVQRMRANGMLQQTDDGFGSTPLGMTVEQIAKLGDSSRAMCKTYVQLVIERPNACGVRLNVNS